MAVFSKDIIAVNMCFQFKMHIKLNEHSDN